MTPTTRATTDSMFGPGPAREPHIPVKERWVECVNVPAGHADALKEFLHRQLNEEVNVLENAARNLTEFTDADWEIRLCLARQCADEARHALAYRRLLLERGGSFGDFPVLNFQYRLLGAIPTLVGRLAVQNRTFEADGLDAAEFGATEARDLGDEALADLYEAQAADEVTHVRFANEWIKRTIATNPRSVLDMAAALTRGAAAFEWVFAEGGAEGIRYPVAQDARLCAGFSQAEIEAAAEQSQSRRSQSSR